MKINKDGIELRKERDGVQSLYISWEWSIFCQMLSLLEGGGKGANRALSLHNLHN